jgi:hypothetical protein
MAAKTGTYTLISSTTLSTATTTVTFSSIPSTYTDLVLVLSLKTSNPAYQPIVRFNSDTGSNYSATAISGNGSSAVSSRHTNQNGIYCNPGAGTGGTVGNFMPWIISVQDYANTTTYKSALARFNNPDSLTNALVGLWRNTAAITSISIVAESGSGDFQSNSTFRLYGIEAGNL